MFTDEFGGQWESEAVARQTSEPVEAWQKVWREGIAPRLSVAGLTALRNGLFSNDENLVTGCTTHPPALQSNYSFPCEMACPIGYVAWQGEGKATVGEVTDFFANLCYQIDMHFGEPQASRYFLNWVDDSPRETMRTNLLAEVERSLSQRQTRLAS